MTIGFKTRMVENDVSPLWAVMANLVTEAPKPGANSFMWRYDALRALLLEAGDHITAEEAERRVLILENPGLNNAHRVTDALYAGLQLVLPGETAPNHRHTQSAAAVYAGVSGAGTLVVDGQRYDIGPRDIVAVPSWCVLEIAAGDEDFVVFSYSDRTCHEKLGFWREERL